MKSLASSCPEELSRGNVLAWPDFLSGITGKVKVDSSSIFCSGEDFSLTPTLPCLGFSGMFCRKHVIQNSLGTASWHLSTGPFTRIHLYLMFAQRMFWLLKLFLHSRLQSNWAWYLDEDKISFQRWMGISEFVLFLLFEIFNFIFIHMCSLHVCLCLVPMKAS